MYISPFYFQLLKQPSVKDTICIGLQLSEQTFYNWRRNYKEKLNPLCHYTVLSLVIGKCKKDKMYLNKLCRPYPMTEQEYNEIQKLKV